MKSETPAEFMQISTESNREALDENGRKPALDGSVLHESTDTQCFRELVESLVQNRSEGQARKSPRFSTPAALCGLKGFGYDGVLFSEATNTARGAGDAPGGTVNPQADAGRLYGIKIVDFSENGVQIQFECNKPFQLFGSHLLLKIQNARIPVELKWCRQSQPFCRGGLFFSERIDSGRKLAGIISDLGTHLVDYLVHGFTTKRIPFREQAGVYAYLAIFYTLRLHFLESFEALKASETQAGEENGSSCQSYLRGCNNGHLVTSLNSMDERLFSIFMKPYNDFGCGLFGMAEDVVLPQQDVRAAVLNSMLFTRRDLLGSRKLLPSIEHCYRRFRELKLLLPGVFESEEFDSLFKYYNSMMFQLNQQRMLKRILPRDLIPKAS
ncbi:MAG: hypothetical protein ACLQDI_18435 [Syntrophobacteraceae bacterium]